jgi:hypothetical protein
MTKRKKKRENELIHIPVGSQAYANKRIVKYEDYLDNPVLRHLAKKHNLKDTEKKLLGVLLYLTRNGEVDIKTDYSVIAEASRISTIDVYRGIASLKRENIIDYKPDGNFVHISFKDIDDDIEEINLAKENARKIKRLEKEITELRAKNFIEREDLFDLLIPIIGKVVQKKIRDALIALTHYIDQKLEEITSMKIWMYRFKSWKTGLPLSEIILRDSLPYIIDEIFVIEKESSIPIANASRLPEEIDKDLVGSMLSAINDFIKTSFNKEENLNEIQYGEYKIWIAESQYFFTAFVIYGIPDMEFYDKAEELIIAIHKRYGKILKDFDGNMEKVKGIKSLLEEFLETINKPPKTEEEKSLIRVKIFAGIIATIILFFIGKGIYWHIHDSKLREKIISVIEKNVPKFLADVKVKVDKGNVLLSGFIGDRGIGEKIEKLIKNKISDIKSIKNKLVFIDIGDISKKYEKHLLKVKKEVSKIEFEKIKEKLEKIVIRFPKMVSELSLPQKVMLDRVVAIMKEYPNLYLDIVVFVDETGTYELNKRLSKERGENVVNYLVSHGISRKRLKLYPFHPDILEANPYYAKYRTQRGVMFFPKLNP